MRVLVKILLFISLWMFLSGCISTNFYKTGKDYAPLNKNEDIAVFTSTKPNKKFNEIGLLRIRGGSQDKRIIEAKEYAKQNGGNGLIVREIGIITEPGTENVVEKIGSSTYETQEFVIIRFESGKYIAQNDKLEESKENIEPVAEISSGTSQIDYSKIPRASFNQLVKDYKSLKGKMFRGTLYPKKVYKIPSSLKPYIEEKNRLVLLTTKSGNKKIFLVIKKNNIGNFRTKIGSGKSMDLIYSPESVFTDREGLHPVINFVEEVNLSKK